MRRAIGSLAVLLFAHAAPAQTVAPARDRPNGSASGTAVLAGRVVDAQTGRSVARARVRLVSLTANIEQRSVLSDAGGAFTFAGLPAGRFAVSAAKSTYISGQYPEPGRTLRSSEPSLSLRDGEKNTDIVVRMQHGGAIAGRIVDAAGDPVEFAQVQVFRLARWGGKLQARTSTMSDDLGQFRVARLEAGRYVLAATPPRVQGFLTPDEPRSTDPEPLPTFYPGAIDISQAAPIAVAAGATVSDIELPLQEGALARVSGTLVDAAGSPVGGSIMVQPIVKEAVFGRGNGWGHGIGPQGTFELRLAPGEYALEGHGSHSPFERSSGEQMALLRLKVAGDVSGLILQLGSGATISGRFVFEGNAPAPPVSSNMTLAFAPSSDGEMCKANGAQLISDWTFNLQGVFGTCVARVEGNTGRWVVKAVMYKGENLGDRPTAFASGQEMRGVEVVMTDQRTDVDIRVADEHGVATREYVALLFPVNRARWTPIAVDSLHLLIPRTSPDSPEPREDEVMRGLSAGDYYAAALDDLEVDGFRDPVFLEQLARVATRVTVTEGARNQIRLRRITLSPALRPY